MTIGKLFAPLLSAALALTVTAALAQPPGFAGRWDRDDDRWDRDRDDDNGDRDDDRWEEWREEAEERREERREEAEERREEARERWEDFAEDAREGRRDGRRYTIRTPWGFGLDVDVDRDGYRRDWYRDDDRYRYGVRRYPYRTDRYWYGGRHYPGRHDYRYGGGRGYWRDSLPYQLARHADRLFEAIRDSHFRYGDREITERAERFARAADDFYEEYRERDGRYSHRAFRKVTRRWTDLDARLSRISPHRHGYVLDLARDVDHLWSRLDDRVGRR